MTTLEEYYVGELYLPVGNAVSDGMPVTFLFYLISGIMGNSFWTQRAMDADWMNITGIEYLTLGQVIISLYAILVILVYIFNIKTILASKWFPWEN